LALPAVASLDALRTRNQAKANTTGQDGDGVGAV